MKKHPLYDVWFTEDGKAFSKRNQLTPRLGGAEGYKRYYLEVRVSPYERINKPLARWLGETYIPNPENLSDVDHIDKDPLNDVVSNLQWLSHQQNCEKEHAKFWLIVDVHFNVTFEVYNLKQWCRDNGVRFTNLLMTSPDTKCVRRNHSGGYKILQSVTNAS